MGYFGSGMDTCWPTMERRLPVIERRCRIDRGGLAAEAEEGDLSASDDSPKNERCPNTSATS
jgi:hypothetical protein